MFIFFLVLSFAPPAGSRDPVHGLIPGAVPAPPSLLGRQRAHAVRSQPDVEQKASCQCPGNFPGVVQTEKPGFTRGFELYRYLVCNKRWHVLFLKASVRALRGRGASTVRTCTVGGALGVGLVCWCLSLLCARVTNRRKMTLPSMS